MMNAAEIAYAKINLALHVRRRRADGYHDLETLFAFAEDGDRLRAAPADVLSLSISGPFAAGLSTIDNLVMHAARGFFDAFSIDGGVALHLAKNLPVAAGIGGGSADAAAALRLLCRLHGVDVGDARIDVIARGLGADVPACVRSETARGEGRGDDLAPLAAGALASAPLLLVNPRAPLTTGPVFGAWDRIDRGPLAAGDPLAAAKGGRNDLEPPARTLLPVIGEVIRLLAAQPGATLARMSGSGATCFALFESLAARDDADAVIAAARPGWWRLATRLR